MSHKFTWAEVSGGPNALIPAFKFAASKQRISLDACVAVASGIAQMLARTTLANVIEPQLEECKDAYEIVNGAYDGSVGDEWESGADDATEGILTEYEKSLSANWMGVNCVDVHMQDEDYVSRITSGFVNDAMAELLHDGSEKPDDPDTRVKTHAKILSACGVVKSDLVPFCHREAVDVITEEDSDVLQAAHAAATLQETPMDANLIYNAVYENFEGAIDLDEVTAHFDNAVDSDAGLSLSGLTMLGLTADAVPTLRAMIADEGGDVLKAGAEFAFMVSMAPYAVTAVETDDASEPEEDEAALLASMGLTPDAPLPVSAPVAGLPAITVAPPAVVPPRALNRPPVNGELPARAIVLLRQYIKMKDEDMAAIVGVSRQTYINYEKGKAKLVLNDAQRDALVVVCNDYMTALREALTLIEGV